MKKVLLLGDSIREGYEPFVREALAGTMDVVAPSENGRFSHYTLWGVNLWLKELGTPDIVHWNNGLWDIHHESPMIEALTPLDSYLEALRRTAAELQRTNAKIIFATTTPVHPDSVGRDNAEIEHYNAAAMQLLSGLGIVINDLNGLIKLEYEKYICEDRLHLNEAGYRKCGMQVVDSINTLLG